MLKMKIPNEGLDIQKHLNHRLLKFVIFSKLLVKNIQRDIIVLQFEEFFSCLV